MSIDELLQTLRLFTLNDWRTVLTDFKIAFPSNYDALCTLVAKQRREQLKRLQAALPSDDEEPS